MFVYFVLCSRLKLLILTTMIIVIICISCATLGQCNVKYKIKKNCERECINVNNIYYVPITIIYTQHKY